MPKVIVFHYTEEGRIILLAKNNSTPETITSKATKTGRFFLMHFYLSPSYI
jgi:hypothetical protein